MNPAKYGTLKTYPTTCPATFSAASVGVEVHAPAKLNLFLEVVSKRSDGYHQLETLMVPINLFDTLLLRPLPPGPGGAAGEIRFCCSRVARCPASGGGVPGFVPTPLPLGSDNLVVRAVELLRARAGTCRGADIRLIKRIPTAAGLGGGSSDAAAALWAANEVWQLGWTLGQLAELAAELGSDVPFFLWCQPAICRGRGEEVEPVGGLGDLHAVVVHPPSELSTADVYGRCRVPQVPRSVGPLVDALRSGNQAAAGRAVYNRLQETAAQLSPWVEQLENEFCRFNFSAHQLSGSGTAYYGLCRHARHARSAAARLSATLGHSGSVQVFGVRRAA